MSDNGTSAEGGPHGSVNEHRFVHGLDEDLDENLARIDDLGGFRAYNHYAWGWAWAGNTPLRLWKRYTWLGGVRTPLIVHWPNGIAARGEVREQFCHAVDLMPTILDAAGIDPPATVDGVEQQPIDGTSLLGDVRRRDGARAPRLAVLRDARQPRDLPRRMEGDDRPRRRPARGRAGATSRAAACFDEDNWLLFDLAHDFSESHDLAAEQPERLQQLIDTWWSEAERNHVLPARRLVHRPGRRDVPAAVRPASTARCSSRVARPCPRTCCRRSAPDTSSPRASRSTRTRTGSSSRSATGPTAARSSCSTAGSCTCSTATATRT